MIPLLIQFNTKPTSLSIPAKKDCRRYFYQNNIPPATPGGMTYIACDTGRRVPLLLNFGDTATVCAYSGSQAVAIKGTITDIGGC
jgi:hypothetical protein